MNKTTMLVCVLTVSSIAVQARIGETVQKCAARYGAPVTLKLDDTKTGVAVYDKNDLTIKVHFTAGKVDLIRYSPGIVHELDLEMAKDLLARNGRDKEWAQLTDTEEVIYDTRDEQAQHPRIELVDPILWETKDELLEARYSNSQSLLEIRVSGLRKRMLEDL